MWLGPGVLFCQESFAGGLGMLVYGPKSVSLSSWAAAMQPVGARLTEAALDVILYAFHLRDVSGGAWSSLLLSLGKEFD